MVSGTVNGVEASSNDKMEVISGQSGTYLVRPAQSIEEVHITNGRYSDGNSLSDVEVEVFSERERIIQERFKNLGSNAQSAKGAKTISVKAPMPGLVKSVLVEVGTAVKKGSSILILEAMKMENTVSATMSGTVKKLNVQAGASVEKNALICEIEID
jgi:biotin carboxyl carrier protein